MAPILCHAASGLHFVCLFRESLGVFLFPPSSQHGTKTNYPSKFDSRTLERSLLNSSSNVAPKGTWWPELTFDLCVLAADTNGFQSQPLSDFIKSPRFGALGLFDWAFQGDTSCTKPTPMYVCLGPGPEEKGGQGQNARCGGADSFYCGTWGCETIGTVYWLTGPVKDLIQVKLPQDFPPCKTLSSKPGQCFPL